MDHYLMEDNIAWRENRRKKWSEYKGCFTNLEDKLNFQKITGLDDSIVECEENIEVQLWVDNMVERLLQRFEDLELPPKMNFLTILLRLGFNKTLLDTHGGFKNEIEDGPVDENDMIYHMTVDELLEAIIRCALYFV